MECLHPQLPSRSRSGCSPVSASSSATTSAESPSSTSVAIRSSTARRRSSPRRRTFGLCPSSNANSASAGPRQSSSACRSSDGAPLGRATCVRQQLLEAMGVDLIAGDLKDVSRRARHQNLRAEEFAKRDDRVLERRSRGFRRLRAVQTHRRAAPWDDATRPQEQRGEERALPRPPSATAPARPSPRADRGSESTACGATVVAPKSADVLTKR